MPRPLPLGAPLRAPPLPPAGSFEELIRLLRGEHARLAHWADGLAAENRRLRACRPEGCVEGILKGEPRPSLLSKDGPGSSFSSWRQRVDVCLEDVEDGAPPEKPPEAPVVEKMLPPPPARHVTISSASEEECFFLPSDSVRSGKSGVSGVSEAGGPWAAVASEDRRLEVCMAKLREFLELSGARQTVSCERVEDYLKRIGRPSEQLLVAFAGVFDRLVECERFSGAASNTARAAFGSHRSKSRVDLGDAASISSPANPGRPRKPGSGLQQQVQLKTLAELLLAEDVEAVLGACSDETLDCVKLLRMCTFHQDTMGVLPSLRAVNDLELECKQALLERRIDLVMNLVIAANAVCVGVFASGDQALKELGPAQLSNIAFTLVFLGEALFKMRMQGLRRYFLGPDWAWNLFDLAVVCLGIGDFFVVLVLVSSGSFNTSSLMLLKLLRLGRLLRVLRMSVFRELKLMINGILGLFKTLSCAMIILMVSVYLISTILVQFLSGSENDHFGTLFSSVPWSMFTVFRCLSLGDCAAPDGTPIVLHLTQDLGWPFATVHFVLSVVMHYGLGSLITALVVETTLNEAKKAEFRATLNEKHKKQVSWSLHRLEQIFEQAQQAEDRKLLPQLPSMLFVGRKTFEQVVRLEEVQRIFDLLDIDAADRLELFDCMDSDGNGYVEIDEVVAGLLSMAGKARRADIVATRLKIDSLVKRFASTHAELLEGQAIIMDRLGPQPSTPAARSGAPSEAGSATPSAPRRRQVSP